MKVNPSAIQHLVRWGSLKARPPSDGELRPISIVRPSSARYFEATGSVGVLDWAEPPEVPVELHPAMRALVAHSAAENNLRRRRSLCNGIMSGCWNWFAAALHFRATEVKNDVATVALGVPPDVKAWRPAARQFARRAECPALRELRRLPLPWQFAVFGPVVIPADGQLQQLAPVS